MADRILRGLVLAMGAIALLGLAATAAEAQNIPEPDPNLKQTFTGEVVYKETAGTNYGVIAVYNQDEKYAKEFKFQREEWEKLEIEEGDEVQVTWVGPRKDRAQRNELKIKKMRAGEDDEK